MEAHKPGKGYTSWLTPALTSNR